MKLDDKYKLNLQFFAEDGEGDSEKIMMIKCQKTMTIIRIKKVSLRKAK